MSHIIGLVIAVAHLSVIFSALSRWQTKMQKKKDSK